MDDDEEGYDEEFEEDDEYIDDYEEFINPCQELINKFEYRKAIECMKYHLLDDNTGNYNPPIQLCFEKLNDYFGFFEFALEHFVKGDDLDSFVVDSIYKIFVKLNGVEKASILVKDYILKSNLSKERKYHLMINYPKINLETDEILRFYMEALESNSQNTDAMINIGKIYYNLKDYKIALDWYLKALDITPNNIDLILDISHGYNRLNDKKMKLKYHLMALEIDPDHEIANFSMALFHEEIREKTEEEIEDDKVGHTKAVSIWDQYNRGYKLASEGDYTGAIVEITKSIEQCENSYFPEGLKARGLLRIKIGNKEEGMKDLKLARDFLYSIVTEIMESGIEYYHMEDYKRSLKALSIAIELDPMLDEAYFFRARTYLRIGKKEEACADLHKAVELGRIGAMEIIKEECNNVLVYI